MRLFSKFLILFIFVGLVSSIGVALAAQYNISGYVFDNNGDVLEGVSVENNSIVSITHASGYYNFSNFENDTYNLSYSKIGFDIGYLEVNISDADNTTANITIYDNTPPGYVASLNNITYATTYINWTWTDPSDSDFANVSIWINNTFMENVTKGTQFYSATGLSPDTQTTISTKTQDMYGNVNDIWTNHTAKTALDTTHPVINDKYLSKTSNVNLGETLTVTINVTDNIEVTLVTANNNINLTQRNATHWNGTVTADSTKKVDIIAYDAAGNTNTTTLTYTLYTSNGGGGGGGGGGGTSGEAFANIVCTETDRQFVGKDLNVKYNFELKGNYVQHIEFTGATSAGKVAAKVEILNHTSTIVNKDAPNIVFKNLNVWIGNKGYFSSNNVKDPTITFTVDRSWVRDNDIILNTISFYSYNDRTTIWKKMSTQKIGEDSTSYLFKASLPIRGSLGPMAISGTDRVYVPTSVPTPTPVITPTPNIADHPTPEITPTTIPVTWTGTWKAKVPGFQLLAALIVLITLYLISRRRD